MSADARAESLISIIVPAYNVERFLGETLKSVLAQTETRWECVVVDDGSTDDTFAIASAVAESDPRVRALRIEHAGTSRARNEGFRRTTAPYVTFMDADDIWLPHALDTLSSRLEADDALVGSHGLCEQIDAAGRPTAPGLYAEGARNRLGLEGRRLVRWPLDRPTSFEVLVNGNVLFPPGLVLARRRAYELAGPFDEALAGPEDWDMLIRLSRFGDLALVNDVLLLYRQHGSNQGARPATAGQAWLVRCIAFHSPENSPGQRQVARRGWRAYQLSLARERVQALARALAAGRIDAAGSLAARVVVHLWRWVRGYPRPRIRREPLVW